MNAFHSFIRTPLAMWTAVMLLSTGAWGQGLTVGDDAVLFESWDENEYMVDMADMIEGKPLVLVTGSCT